MQFRITHESGHVEVRQHVPYRIDGLQAFHTRTGRILARSHVGLEHLESTLATLTETVPDVTYRVVHVLNGAVVPSSCVATGTWRDCVSTAKRLGKSGALWVVLPTV